MSALTPMSLMEIHARKKSGAFCVQPQALQVRNGPFTDIVWPHINHEIRDALQISTGGERS